jgi:hypothetical protein
MHRPLWQILFTLSFVGLSMQRVVVAFALDWELHPALIATFACQTAAAILVVIGLWFSRNWTVGALVALGAFHIVAALEAGLWLGLQPPAAAISESVIVALATGALALALTHEFPHDGRERERDPTPRTPGSRREMRHHDASRRDQGGSRV